MPRENVCCSLLYSDLSTEFGKNWFAVVRTTVGLKIELSVFLVLSLVVLFIFFECLFLVNVEIQMSVNNKLDNSQQYELVYFFYMKPSAH